MKSSIASDPTEPRRLTCTCPSKIQETTSSCLQSCACIARAGCRPGSQNTARRAIDQFTRWDGRRNECESAGGKGGADWRDEEDEEEENKGDQLFEGNAVGANHQGGEKCRMVVGLEMVHVFDMQAVVDAVY